MEALAILEKKLIDLAEVTKHLKKENLLLSDKNKELIAENEQLKSQISSLEDVLLKSSEGLEEEKNLTKMAVDSLIKSIDSLMESEKENGEKEI